MESCLTDMHIHSTASDGTDGVRELLANWHSGILSDRS